MVNIRIEKINIDTLKSVCGVETSESLFGIAQPPDYQCNAIDSMIRDMKSVDCDAQSIQKNEDISECHSTARDIEYNIAALQNELEKLRRAVDALRGWGEQWKCVAKKMCEHSPNCLPHVLEDHLYPKFEIYFNS